MSGPKLTSFLSGSKNQQICHVLQQTAVSFRSEADDFLSEVSLGEIIASDNGAIAAYSEHNLSMTILSFTFKASTASQITSK